MALQARNHLYRYGSSDNSDSLLSRPSTHYRLAFVNEGKSLAMFVYRLAKENISKAAGLRQQLCALRLAAKREVA